LNLRTRRGRSKNHKKDGKKDLQISNGIIRVHENKINIFPEVGVGEGSAEQGAQAQNQKK